jgi:hypothetical protein
MSFSFSKNIIREITENSKLFEHEILLEGGLMTKNYTSDQKISTRKSPQIFSNNLCFKANLKNNMKGKKPNKPPKRNLTETNIHE